MPELISHDQNFKNLILDYPLQAVQFFAPEEAADLDDSVKITPIRQEQLKNRLGDRFHELDVPLQVEWRDGRRAALLFLFEEESDSARFSIYRLGRYCLDLAELMKTDRVVPVVIFLKDSQRVRTELHLGTEHQTFLSFHYLRRLALEPDTEKRLKYMDFIDTYAQLDDNDRKLFTRRYPREDKTMTTWSQRMLAQGRQEGRQEGLQKGLQKGRHEGEANALLKLLVHRFGPLGDATTEHVRNASEAELQQWLINCVSARTLDEVFGSH